MTDKELKKLSKTDLLEMLIEQGKEIEKLKSIIAQNEQQLENKKIMLNEAGSIAEAALKINNVFEDAQLAANQYLESVRGLIERQSEICAQAEKESKKKCEQMLAEAERKCTVLERETQEKCSKMIEEAEYKSTAYWETVYSNIDKYVKQHAGLKELLSTTILNLNQE